MQTAAEPIITINGVTLTNAQAATVRCAIADFWEQLTTEGLGDDAHGHAMVAAYTARLREVSALIAPAARAGRAVSL